MFWNRKKSQYSAALELSESTPSPSPSSPLAASKPRTRTRDRSQSAPPRPSQSHGMSLHQALRVSTDIAPSPVPTPQSSPLSPKRAIFSSESIVPIYLSTPSPAQEKPYPTRDWDGSGDFPDTHGLVAELNFDVLNA
ncbi:hypothetical protein EXIGLDRAFT_729295 [Exidia glandulosa HHB12029]|uniref:Uncharacterized protein n=1 Tax=Exidia glandulosa HHB12029 TaxID=1314781 RepID=A0A165CNA5_EXIGL|nr:hypothetical protein EXIGLDRAFT_729295 [Exidia glandulosa HHB12029]